MVKIIEKSLDERAQEEKCNNLVALTEGTIGDKLRVTKGPGIVFGIYDKNKGIDSTNIIIVDASINEMRLYNPTYLDLATRLAQLYEKDQPIEYTIRTRY